MDLKRMLCLALMAGSFAIPASAQTTAFQHVIVVVQENRTPDNLFQGLCAVDGACSTTPQPGQYDIQTSNWFDKTSQTGATNPTPIALGINYDLSHLHNAFLAECDMNGGSACAMDGAAHVPCNGKCPPQPAFGYVDNSQGAVQPYIDLVHAYGWGNYFFQTNQGPSFPAHQFLFGATSAPSADDDQAGTFASGNPSGGVKGENSGCAAPTTSRVGVINSQGLYLPKIYPCFEHQTLSDLLDAQAVTWRYYGVRPGGLWTAPNAISHICQAQGTSCTGSEFTSNVDFNPPDVLTDISTNCSLRGVSWVTPDMPYSDHAGNVLGTGGPSWVASIVNAVGSSTCTNPDGSSYWDTTAIIVVWDDWGGWYDHEAPPIEPFPQGAFQMGFRVPLIVVSAYTPAGLVSNTPEDFGSVSRFIEQNFGIPEGALTFADARSTGDLTEFFSNAPGAKRSFHAIRTPISAAHFVATKQSGSPPDTD